MLKTCIVSLVDPHCSYTASVHVSASLWSSGSLTSNASDVSLDSILIMHVLLWSH
ncbi:hypothetical protein Bca4012_026341 [Brassica carinata]